MLFVFTAHHYIYVDPEFVVVQFVYLDVMTNISNHYIPINALYL